MNIFDAETVFKKGLTFLADGRPADASQRFLAAMRIEKEQGAQRRDMRYLSFYGLSLAMCSGRNPNATAACRKAIELERWNPQLYLNMAKVYRLAGRTSRCMETLERGLRIDPDNSALRRELGLLERRSAPPIRRLRRKHFLNRVLGKIRYSLGRRNNARQTKKKLLRGGPRTSVLLEEAGTD